MPRLKTPPVGPRWGPQSRRRRLVRGMAAPNFAVATTAQLPAEALLGIQLQSLETVSSLLDDFNRTNENPISGAGAWETNVGALAGCQVTSNRIGGTTTTTSEASYSALGSLTDCEASLTIAVLPVGADNIGVVVRQQTNQNTGNGLYCALYVVGTGIQLFRESVAGGQTQLGSTFAVTLAAGDKIRLQAIGSTLRVFYMTSSSGGTDWQLAITTSDTTFLSGWLGVRMRGVTCRGDDFSGGATTAGRDLPLESSVSLSVLAATFELPFEVQAGIAASVQLALEAVQPLSAARSLALESLVGLALTAQQPLEALRGLAASGQLPLEELSGRASSSSLPLDALQKLAAIAALPSETLASLAGSAALPAETTSGLHAPAALTLEALQALTALEALPLEALRQLAASGQLPLDSVAPAGEISALFTLPVETLKPLSAQLSLPAAALHGIGAAQTVTLEALAGIIGLEQVPLETLLALAAALGLPFEAMHFTPVTSAFVLPLDALLRVRALAANPLETIIAQGGISRGTTARASTGTTIAAAAVHRLLAATAAIALAKPTTTATRPSRGTASASKADDVSTEPR